MVGWDPNPAGEAFDRSYNIAQTNSAARKRQQDEDEAALKRLRERFSLERQQRDYEADQNAPALVAMLRGRPELAADLGIPVKPGQPAVPAGVGPEREVEAGTTSQQRPATTADWEAARSQGSATGMARDTVDESYPRRSPITTAPLTSGRPATAPEVQVAASDVRGIAPFLKDVLHQDIATRGSERLAKAKVDEATRQKLEMGGRFADVLDKQLTDNPNLPPAYQDQVRMLSGMARAGQIDAKDAAQILNPMNRFVMERMQGGGTGPASGQGRTETTTKLGTTGASIEQRDLPDLPNRDMRLRQQATAELTKELGRKPTEDEIAVRANKIDSDLFGQRQNIINQTHQDFEQQRPLPPNQAANVVDENGRPVKGVITQGRIRDEGLHPLRPADAQALGQVSQIQGPFKQMLDVVEKGKLPAATGSAPADVWSAWKSEITGQATQFSDPEIAKFVANQQNILFPLIRFEGGASRTAIQELMLRMKANPRLLDTDLSATAKLDALAEIVETRFRSMGLVPAPELQEQLDRAHRLSAQIGQGTQKGGAVPNLSDRAKGLIQQYAPR